MADIDARTVLTCVRATDKDEEENEEYNYFGIVVEYKGVKPFENETERFYPLG